MCFLLVGRFPTSATCLQLAWLSERASESVHTRFPPHHHHLIRAFSNPYLHNGRPTLGLPRNSRPCCVCHCAPMPHSWLESRTPTQVGPVHPHAVFRSSPYQIETNSCSPSPQSDPIEVARRFARDHLDGHFTPHNTFTIRK